MTPPNYFPGNAQWLGIARETTPGVAAAAPTAFVPLISPKLQTHITTLPDTALRGSMAKTFGMQQGIVYPEFTYQTYPYLDSVYQHVLAVLGTADAVSGAADPWTHKTALTNAGQPPSYTLWYVDGAGKAWQIVGAKNSNLKIDAKVDALAQIDAGWIGLSSTPIAPPTNTPTGNPPMPTWNAAITVAGVAMGKYSDLALTLKRATEPINTLNGTQAPTAIYAGELDVTGDLTGIYQGSTDNDLQNYLTNGQPTLTVKLAPAGDATHGLTLQCSKAAYTDASFSGSNKWMEIASKVTAIGNTTDALDGVLSPAQAIFTTPASTAY